MRPTATKKKTRMRGRRIRVKKGVAPITVITATDY
jgi:hypothetical protein